MADQGMEVDGETDTSQQACEMVGSRDGDDKEGGDESRTERVARNEGAKDNTSAVPEADPIPSKRARFFDLFGLKRQSSEPGPGNRVNLSKLPIEEKRKYYKCREDYITLSEIPTWSEYHKDIPRPKKSQQTQFRVDCELNDKVSLWRGDITRLEIDAIVNAANSSLMGGGGVDGAIHRAAGSALMAECRTLAGCDTGDAKLTGGHRLPAKYVLHTVGPMNSSSEKLQSCYQCCLELALKHKIRSIAFPCIATGIYGFPNDEAAEIALTITREWLEKHRDKVDRIIFCVFLEVDYKLYCKLLRCVFPVTNPTTQDPLTPVSGVIAEDSTPFKPSMNKSVSAPAGSSSKLVKTAEETQSSESGTAQPAPPEQGLAPSGEVVPSAPELPAQSFPDPGIDD